MTDSNEHPHVVELRRLGRGGEPNRTRAHAAADFLEQVLADRLALQEQLARLDEYILTTHSQRAEESAAVFRARLHPDAVAPGGPGCIDPAGEGAVDAAIRLLRFAAQRGAFAPVVDDPTATAWALWQLLDDIDTADDRAKDNDKHFRDLAMQAASKRNRYFVSQDGQTLVEPRSGPKPVITVRLIDPLAGNRWQVCANGEPVHGLIVEAISETTATARAITMYGIQAARTREMITLKPYSDRRVVLRMEAHRDGSTYTVKRGELPVAPEMRPAELAAVAAYAEAVAVTHPELAKDMRAKYLQDVVPRIVLWQSMLEPVKSRGELPPTIALDFDGTVYGGPWTRADECTGEPIDGAIDWVRKQLAAGCRIIIHTCRLTAPYEGAPFQSADHLDPLRTAAVIRGWFLEHGLSQQEVDKLDMWTRPGKPWAQVYLDDKGVRFPGFYPFPRRRA